MRRWLPLLLLSLGLPLVTGCRGAGWFVAGAVAGVAIATSEHHHHVHEHVIVYEPIPVPPPPRPLVYVPPPAPPDRDRPADPPPPSFDASAARSALSAVDLGACKAAGAPAGYGHARVTFVETGHVAKVVVDSPAGLSPDAVQCIGNRLGTAEVSPFEGSEIAVGHTWLVR
jgi:hypothetical protein